MLRTLFADPMASILEEMSGATTASKKVLMLPELRRCFLAPLEAFGSWIGVIKEFLGGTLRFLDSEFRLADAS